MPDHIPHIKWSNNNNHDTERLRTYLFEISALANRTWREISDILEPAVVEEIYTLYPKATDQDIVNILEEIEKVDDSMVRYKITAQMQ